MAYLSPLGLSISLGKISLHAVLLDLVALGERVSVRARHAVVARHAIAVDALDRPEALLLLLLAEGRQHGSGSGIQGVPVNVYRRAGEVLGDADLDMAQVTLARAAFARLLGRIVGFGRAGGTAPHAAVPVVRDEWFSLVALGRAVRVDIVYVREIRFEP